MSVKTITSDDQLTSIETPFKIEAGPGAGKTHWLINHIKRVLIESKRLGKSKKIACITYTNIGIETIINRLVDATLFVEVSTIHSFLYTHVIKPYIFLIADEFGIPPEKVDGHDEVIPTKGRMFQWKKETNQNYLYDDEKVFNALVSLQWILSSDKKDVELGHTVPWKSKVGKYSIKRSSYYDFKRYYWQKGILHHDDILGFSYKLIKRFPFILRIIRSKFPYIFLDEFQDTNPIQTEIIKLVSMEETIIGVIGDKAQSIYSFQGADVKQFIDFKITNLNYFIINNNRRSSNEIINILNHIRKDISQINPFDKSGNKPTLIIGKQHAAKQKAISLSQGKNIYTLSYKNLTSNEMRNNESSNYTNNLLQEIANIDDSRRTRIIKSCINAIELSRLGRFKDAVKDLAKMYKYTDPETKGQKTALKILSVILKKYNTYKDKSLYCFYEFLKEIEESGLKKESAIKKGKLKDFLDKHFYNQFVLWINILNDESYDRTIHKAKGDEFDNVLLIINNQSDKEFDETKELSFLLDPDLINNETHRVYYVAITRAKENLFINIPQLSNDNEEILKSKGFNIERLSVN